MVKNNEKNTEKNKVKNNVKSKEKMTLHHPQNKLGMAGMICYIIMMDMCIPLSTDMYLPAMPTMTGHLAGATDALVKSTVTVFFLFYALGMLLWGPLSDKYGRKKPMLISFVTYCAATILCAVSMTIWGLLLGRIMQGIGAAGITAISFAMINDCFIGKTRETILAIAQTLSGFAPVLAPIAGSWLLTFTSWRGTFWVLLGFGVIGLALTFMYQETVAAKDRYKGSVIGSLGQLGVVMKNKAFTWIVLIYAIILMPMYAYINLSSYIYVNQFGCTEQGYSYYHALSGLLSMIGPTMYIKMFADSNKNKLTYVCFGFCLLAGLVMMLFGTASPLLLCFLVFIYYIMTNILRPYATNLILSQNPRDVGSSSSVMNMCFNMMAVVGMLLATFSFENMVGALGVILFISSLVALIGWWRLVKSGLEIPLLNVEAK